MPAIKSLQPHLLRLAATAALSCAFSLQAQELGSTLNKSGNSTTSATFRVWAPNASAVSVAGDFNSWNATANELTRNSTTNVWSGTVNAARPGHAYKYVITAGNGTQLWRKDPRARQVRTMSDGSQAAVIYDTSAFVWEDGDYEPPFPNEIVMYELHVGSFFDPTPNDGQPATLYDAALKLDYLRELGVNMIALMPVSEFNGRHSWGYNPTALFAIEETYGGPDALKFFVNEAHKKGMAVQVDVVHNHYGDLAAPGASDLENFDGGEPYFYNAADDVDRPGISRTKWGPRPRYSEPNVRQFISDNIRMYLDEYKIWALRWDSPRNITGYDASPGAQIGDPDATIDEAVTMMQQINASIHSRNPRYYSIAEDANSPGGYSGHWEISFHNVVFPRLLTLTQNGTLPVPFAGRLEFPTLNTRNGTNIGYRLETKEPPGFRVIFSENHDKCGDHNSATDGARLASDFDPVNPESLAARRKTMLTTAITLTSAGTPMLWMGQEQLAKDEFKDAVPMDWLRAGRFEGIVRFHRDLVGLRRNLANKTRALTFTSLPEVDDLTGVTSILAANESEGWMAYERKTGNPSESILVVVNFSASNRTVSFNATSAGPWRVFMNSDWKLYGSDLGGVGPEQGGNLTSGASNRLSFAIAPFSAVVLGKAEPPALSADADANGITDGWEILFSAGNATADPDADGFNNLAEFQNQTDPTVPDRASLPGVFNDWNIVSKNMRWDPVRSVWRHVARFTERGTFECKGYTAEGWAAGPNFSLQVASAGTFEITYHPSTGNYTSTRVDADSNANGMSDTWEGFYFYPAPSANASANPDGDAFTNLQEFQRGSDPTEFDQPAMGVVGGYNDWNWNARNMVYKGHGVWALAHPFRTPPQDRALKFGVGPNNTNPDWGDAEADGTGDFKSTDILWPEGATGWIVVRFNEKNLRYSLAAASAGADSDGDGMPDAWEWAWGLNPLADDPAGDPDGDGVRNLFEYVRLANPLVADRRGQMHMPGRVAWNPANPGEGIWGASDPSTRMVWNPDAGEWEFVLYAPRPREIEFKFAAGTYDDAWGWFANGVEGRAVPSGPANIKAQLGARGFYVAGFDEASGNYSIRAMPAADANGNGIADAWERFHFPEGFVGSNDTDSDGLKDFEEFGRGSNPRAEDHYAVMNLVGDLNAWSHAATPMRRNRLSGLWELVLRTSPAQDQEAKFVAGNSWGSPNWGDRDRDGLGDRNTGNGEGIRYSAPAGTGYFLFRFDEFTNEYSAGSMPAADGDNDGLSDAWAGFHGVSGSSGNPDGDPFPNAQEFARGSDPNVADQYFRSHQELRVAGSFNGWSPATAPAMVLVGDNLWRLDIAISNSTAQEFKFVAGNTWDATNWGNGTGNAALPNLGTGNYRFEVNDVTRAFTISLVTNTFSGRYPGFLANQTVRGLPAKVEYLFGGTAESPPPAAHLPTFGPAGSNMRLSFVRRTEDPALNHVVEFRSDLATGAWQPAGNATSTEDVGSGLQRSNFDFPMEGTKGFYRIRAW